MVSDKLCLSCMREGLANGVCRYCGRAGAAVQNPAHALAPETILHGRYLIGRALGYGGFGVTYAALDLTDGHRVAVKEYMPDAFCLRQSGSAMVRCRTGESDFQYGKAQFLSEARTIHAIRGHPNIIHVEKLFAENNTAYYVMEFLEGCDFGAYLKRQREGKLPFDEAFRLLRPIFSALSLIHERGVIHRDISPDNIHVGTDGTLKLIDFGAAHTALSDRSESVDVVLKRGYAPIEQYMRRGRQGPWTDVYALGCTFYRAVTGRVPPEATARSARDTLIPPREAGAAISREQENALLRAMAVRAEGRFQSAAAFREAIEGAGNLSEPVYFAHPAPIQEARMSTGAKKESSVMADNAKGYGRSILGKRWLALIIDNLLLGFAACIGLFLYGYAAFWWGYAGGALLMILINTMLESGEQQASLGKRAVGLKVITKSGGVPSKGQCFLRNLLRVLPLINLVDIVMALVNEDGRSLHCQLTDTLVVAADYRQQAAKSAGHAPVKAPALGIKGISGVYAGASFPVGEQPLRLGRDAAQCAIIFPPETRGVSGCHCAVYFDRAAQCLVVQDMGSSYGTRLQDGSILKAQQSQQLRVGQSFSMGGEFFSAAYL